MYTQRHQLRPMALTYVSLIKRILVVDLEVVVGVLKAAEGVEETDEF